MCLLYEGGLFFARFIRPRSAAEPESQEPTTAP
jgi:Sec-independent protein secretion pathway component TatC